MRTKKILSVLLVCIMALSLCSCGKDKKKDDNDDSTLPNMSNPTSEENIDGTVTITCEEQNFTVKCKSEYSSSFDKENGLTIYTESFNSIPYILIFRNEGLASSIDVDYYLSQFSSQMEEQYGNNLIKANAPKQYSFGGKTLKGCSYVYMLDEYEIEMLRCVLIDGNDFVVLTTKNIRGKGNETMEAFDLIVSSYTTGKGNTNPDITNNKSDLIQPGYRLEEYKSPVYGIQHIETADYSIDIPEGWEILIIKQFTGLGNGFGFMAYDPNCPDRKLFYYSCIDPFLRSEQAKSNYAAYGYQIYADLPIMNGSVESFYEAYPELMNWRDKYAAQVNGASSASFPDFNAVTVLEKSDSYIPLTPSAYENVVARINYTSDAGNLCEGLMTIQTGAAVDFYGSSADMGLNWGLSMCGFTTPNGELTMLEDTLMKYLQTFTLTDSFLAENSAVTQQNVQNSIQAANELQAVFDSCNAAWAARQTVFDIEAQKWNDVIRGQERIYDSTTDTVYMTDIGYYDTYLSGSSDYILVDDSNSQYYLYSYSGSIVGN